MSVKFQPKIPHRSFIITAGQCHFGVCLKKSWFGVYGFKCKWAAYSHPVSRRGRRYPSLCIELRCWEKMKTLNVQSYIQRHCWCYSCSSAEKVKNSITTEGGSYSNAGLSINPVARPSEMWRHTAVRIKTAGLVRLTWFKGD